MKDLIDPGFWRKVWNGGNVFQTDETEEEEEEYIYEDEEE